MKGLYSKEGFGPRVTISQRKTPTVRQAAGYFGVSKSTVHKDVTERLPGINKVLAKEVKRVLEINKAERHIRGGEATRRKYQAKQEGRVKKGGIFH